MTPTTTDEVDHHSLHPQRMWENGAAARESWEPTLTTRYRDLATSTIFLLALDARLSGAACCGLLSAHEVDQPGGDRQFQHDADHTESEVSVPSSAAKLGGDDRGRSLAVGFRFSELCFELLERL